MKTIVFNGSPRKNGDTMALIREMQKHLDGQIDIISAYYDGISPCIDCRYCWKNEGCAINDPMRNIINDLDSYNNVIVASPLYFSELTGALLSVFSRFQQLYAARRFRGIDKKAARKNGILMLAGGGDGNAGNAGNAEATAKIMFKYMNASYLGMVLSHNTDSIPAEDDGNALNKVREYALLLNKMHF